MIYEFWFGLCLGMPIGGLILVLATHITLRKYGKISRNMDTLRSIKEEQKRSSNDNVKNRTTPPSYKFKLKNNKVNIFNLERMVNQMKRGDIIDLYLFNHPEVDDLWRAYYQLHEDK